MSARAPDATADAGGPPALRIAHLNRQFGGVQATCDVSFEVASGSLTALIGPNGAGKTTLFNLITNLFQPSSGEIAYFGRSLAGLRPSEIAALGLVRTFQTARVFPRMTVLENVLVGAHRHVRAPAALQALWWPSVLREDRALTRKAEALLALTGLAAYRDTAATALPMGAQKMVEVIRALMAGPRLLLLDEPAAGLNDRETADLAVLLRAIGDNGTTIMVVEHNMALVMGVADHVVVLDAGRVIATGTPAEVQADPRVIQAYLGQEAAGVNLELQGVTAGYGATEVVHEVDLSVGAGEIVALIGANGAGKSTLVKTISGLLPIRAGRIRLDGAAVEALDIAARVARGIVHVPEGRQIFAGLAVGENLRLGGHAVPGTDWRARQEEVCARFPALQGRLREPAGNLSGGQQQMLAIGRALMARPKLLLLDEPSLGLAPLLVAEIFAMIAGLRDQGISILLAEQNARMSLAIAARGYVLENGRVALSGTGHELLASKSVAERYLGMGEAMQGDPGVRRHEMAAKLRAALGT